MPTQSLDIISVNLWQMLVSLVNLVILFLLVKKFLYQPVKKMLASRQATIDGEYEAAKTAREQADADRQAYADRLKNAKTEADRVIQNAVELADDRSAQIVAQAKQKADGIIRQAENDAMLERRKAQEGIKKEIVEVSSLLTEKLLQREITSQDHQQLFDTFVESIGDSDDRN